MSGPMLEAPTDFTPFELTEWLETYMLLCNEADVSRAALTRLFPAGQGPDAAELDQLFSEVRRRAEIAPRTYPFRDREESIIIDDTVEATLYQLLLILSIEGAPYRTENRYNEINPVFELITREALLSYMGGAGQGRRFGWPSDDGRPQNLGDAVEWLANEMGLPVGVVRDEVDRDDKDGGIDVVAWKPFADRSPSFNVWLAQCTVQATYERKVGDIKPEKWMAWIRFGQPPARVLSIPYAIPLDAKVRDDLKYSVTLLLDRIRLCELLAMPESLAGFDEYPAMSAWTADELAKTQQVLSNPSAPNPRMAKRRRPRRNPRPGEPQAASVPEVT